MDKTFLPKPITDNSERLYELDIHLSQRHLQVVLQFKFQNALNFAFLWILYEESHYFTHVPYYFLTFRKNPII